MQDQNQRIYRLKVIIVAIAASVSGAALLFLAKAVDREPLLSWLQSWPLSEIGGTLFVTGLLAITWDYLDSRDREARDDARLRRLLRESAPEFVDAVVRGFAVQPDDLKRVATPELLDSVATNALSLRLGDEQFAREIYTDLRDQAIRAAERWYDVEVSIRLSSMDERDASGVPRFAVTVQWEYTVKPTHPVQRFACVSDRDEFNELLTDTPVTSTWFMTPRPGFDASAREAFELLKFSVDGEERTIRRSARKSGQTYSAKIGEDVVRAGKPVRIKHLYKTITPRSGHRLYFEISQPTRGLSLELDYSDTDISQMSVTDLITSAQRPRVSRLPEQVGARAISVDLPGWLLPKAGLSFVWTLLREETSTPSVAPTRASAGSPAGPRGR